MNNWFKGITYLIGHFYVFYPSVKLIIFKLMLKIEHEEQKVNIVFKWMTERWEKMQAKIIIHFIDA